MIIRLTAHRSSQDVVVVHAGPELAEFMGAFAGARWQPQAKAYWLPTAQLDGFVRHAARCDHVVVDDRAKGPEPEKFTGPLPECSACGRPATRESATKLVRCPACGAGWRPVVADAPAATGTWTARVECASCGRTQPGGWAFCGQCGASMPAPGPRGPRPDTVPRPVLGEPTLFGDAVAEVAAGLEDERDFAQRAAGDR